MLPNKGKVALVTGGAKRIGRQVCEHLITEGWSVIVHYNQSASEAQDFAAGNPSIIGIEQGTFSNPESIERFASKIFTNYGKITLLVNNASSFINDNLDNFNIEAWQKNLATNSLAPLLLIKNFAAQHCFDEFNPGRVINLLDNTLKPRGDIFTTYSLSNKLLKHITKLTAGHYAPSILINGIALGTTMRGATQSKEHFNKMVDATLLRKAVSLADLGALLSFLLQSSTMTGQVLKLSSEPPL